MPIMLSQMWDIKHGKEEEYIRFVTDTYIPGVKYIGLYVAGGSYVAIGPRPRIIAQFIVDDLSTMEKRLKSEKFNDLNSKLLEYVEDYGRKVLEPTGRIEVPKYPVQKNVWKIIQYFDLEPGKEDEYDRFMRDDYIPAFRNLGVMDFTGEWTVVHGDKPDIVTEFTGKSPSEACGIYADPEFLRITRILKTSFAKNYSSRLLVSTERFEGPSL
jgi:hypothetical protein